MVDINLLKKGEEKITFKEKENFKDEYERYKVMFKNNQLMQYKLDEKSSSQKDEFISLLIKIQNLEEDKMDSFKAIIKKNLETKQLFNQAIDPSNNELYWYRNCFVLYYSLDNIIDDKKKIGLMKENINSIMKREIFKKDYILNDIELLTSIIILIALPQANYIIEYNLNLIETKDPKYNIDEELKKNQINRYPNFPNKGYYIDENNNINILQNISVSCPSNFLLNIKNDRLNLNPAELNNYDEIKITYNDIIDFERMYKFLSKILCSKVFKEAFNVLYPDHYIYPFKNEEDSHKFLKQYYHFIPLKSLRSGGITEKFSLEIYYLLKARNIDISQNLPNEKDLIVKTLYKGSVVVVSSHEINHEFYNIFLKHSNGKIPLMTSRKQCIDESEGGKNMEMLLFNQLIRKLSLMQCMYLLNEKNYEKSLIEFRDGFNALKIEDLIIDSNGVFPELNNILKIENFEQSAKASTIRCNEEDSNSLLDTYIDDLENVNDVLGSIRDLSKL